MNKIGLFLALCVSFLMISCKTETKEEVIKNETNPENRIVSLSGAITETIAALGHANEIVGRDVTSTYPADLTAKDLGHAGRNMTMEGIMAVNPILIIGSGKDINPDLLKRIQESGIKTKLINQEYSVDGAKKLIKEVAKIIGSKDYEKLYDKIDSDLAQIKPLEKKPKVLFIYSRPQVLSVSGTNTQMDAIIKLAGGENAITEFEDFKPLTPESLIQSNPDVILMFESGLQSAGGMDGILSVPGISQTNAGKNKKIIAMDGGLITNFGPRVGEAALELNQKLIESTK